MKKKNRVGNWLIEMQLSKSLVIILFMSLFCNFASGAEFYKSKKETSSGGGCSQSILIKGDIEKGDFQKFKKAIQEIKQSNCYISSVHLISNGGDVLEAIAIGSEIRKNLITTWAPWDQHFSDGGEGPPSCGVTSSIIFDFNSKRWKMEPPQDYPCDCNSACFLIWAAGVMRTGSSLGLHRPYFSKEYYQGLSAAEAEEKYKQLSSLVRTYLSSMDIPNDIIDEMFSHSSEDIYYLYMRGKEGSIEQNIKGLTHAPFFEELLIAKCSPLTDEELKAHQDLIMKFELTAMFELTAIEKHALQSLKEKYDKYSKCHSGIKREAQLSNK